MADSKNYTPRLQQKYKDVIQKELWRFFLKHLARLKLKIFLKHTLIINFHLEYWITENLTFLNVKNVK